MHADQKERFSRHIRLPEIGEAGQEKLLNGKVLLVGCGGLGSPIALYLAAAGVGTLGLMDGDCVDLSNLQRQILHGQADIGRPKSASASERLQAINSDLTLQPIAERLTTDNAALLADYDFVVDATDNFDSKFLIADLCHQYGKAYSHAGISAFHGQLMTVIPGTSACYRCIFGEQPPEQPSDLAPSGPLGALPGVIGSLQALESIKYLTGLGELLTDRLLTFDALTMTFRTIPLKRNPACTLCQ